MPTEEERTNSRKNLSVVELDSTAIAKIRKEEYACGFADGIAAMERGLSDESTGEAAMKNFGWGRRSKASLITIKTILKEAAGIAAGNAKKRA